MDDEKGKSAIVYKTKKKKRKRIGKKKITRACLKRLIAKNYAHSFSCFTLKLAFSPALYKFIVWVIWT